MQEFDELAQIMQRLRSPQGCPWDREQNHASLKQHLLEEAYELIEAIDAGRPPDICEELGDVLLQVVFHAQIAAERGEFDLRDVVSGLAQKLYYRHPHVFGEVELETSEQVIDSWERLKRAEYPQGERESVLDGVPQVLPALQRAQKLHKRAAKVGFDWPDLSGAREKVSEEIQELDEALAAGDPAALAHEIGDLLAAVVNLSRFVGVEAEGALREANQRFESRFRAVEAAAGEQGRDLGRMSLAEMDALWERAKAQEAHAD